MSDGWSFTAISADGVPRNTEQTSGAVISYDQLAHPGVIRIPVDIGDLWEDINNTRNTLIRDLPSDWTSIRLKIHSFNPVKGNQQATLVAYQDDDNYVQVSRTYEVSNRIMFTSEAEGHAINLNSTDETDTLNIYLRLDRDSFTESITSYYSTNGTDWTEVGTVVQQLNSPKLAIHTGASPDGFPNADIEWAEVSTIPLPPVNDELRAQPGSLVFNCRQGSQCIDTRSVFIFSAMGKSIRWTQSADASWLTGDLLNGVTEGKLKVSVNTSGLEPGIYNGNITLESTQSVSGPVIIPVSLIINPSIPVSICVWKNGIPGAMSVSVDDGQPSAFDELTKNGFRGTYVYNGSTPPAFYSNYYNSGMEVGPHLVNHPCHDVTDDNLRSQEILPNVMNLCSFLSLPPEDIISLVWPCGYTNYHEQAVATEYFLSARGYNINELEDPTPENMMNLKGFNSHEHTPFPPADLKTLVDSAVSKRKWFNLVLHNMTNDDGAIDYAKTKNIWVAPIGTVIKYLLQRDRYILDNYSSDSDGIIFDLSRLAIPPSVSRNFENAFKDEDCITLQVDIDDNRLVESLLIDGIPFPFQTVKPDGNIVLLTNIRPDPNHKKKVEIHYREKPVVPVNISSHVLNFITIVNNDPESQKLFITGENTGNVRWKAEANPGGQNWKMSFLPATGQLNDPLTISVNCAGLPVGKYSKTFTILSTDGDFYPEEIEVKLDVTGGLLHQNYPNPFSKFTWIEYDLPEDGQMTLEIYNSQGQKCSEIENGYMLSGNYRRKWYPGSLASGIYFLQIRTRNYNETLKIIKLK